MPDALTPAGVDFRHVSKSLATVRLIAAVLSLGIPAVAFVVLGIVFSPWFYVGAGLAALIFLWLLWLIPRQVRAIQFATTETDFLVRKGIMFRRLDLFHMAASSTWMCMKVRLPANSGSPQSNCTQRLRIRTRHSDRATRKSGSRTT